MAQFVYPTEAQFNTQALVAGMNAFYTMQKLIAPGAVAKEVLVVGQLDPEAALVFRVMVVYFHTESLTMGVQACDISYELLRDLEIVGTPEAS